MRYDFSEFAPSNKRQYVLKMGVKDIEIMQGLAQNALLHMPQIQKDAHPDYYDIRVRLGKMNKALQAALNEALELGDEGERRPPLKRGQRV